jgi:hypothetical protein
VKFSCDSGGNSRARMFVEMETVKAMPMKLQMEMRTLLGIGV